MFSIREAATMLAALRYWREEMVPHGRAIMRPYFRDLKLGHVTPLNTPEIEKLSSRLKAVTAGRTD